MPGAEGILPQDAFEINSALIELCWAFGAPALCHLYSKKISQKCSDSLLWYQMTRLNLIIQFWKDSYYHIPLFIKTREERVTLVLTLNPRQIYHSVTIPNVLALLFFFIH